MSDGAPRLRQSYAKTLLTECPALVRLALDGERRAGSRAMRRGSLVDQLVFGGAQYEVITATLKSGPRKGQAATNYQCKEAQEQRDAIEQRGWLPVLESELEVAHELAGRVRAELILAGIDIGQAALQETIQWDTLDGTAAEGTPDIIIRNERYAHTIDLKVGESANPDKLDSQVDSMFWDMQGAVYQEAVSAKYGTHGQHWILRVDAESKLVGLYPLSESYISIGRAKWSAAQRIWNQCVRDNNWPGFARRPIQPTQAVLRRAEEKQYL